MRGTSTAAERWPCRSPCGERGLKCGEVYGLQWDDLSLPVRGAWVEIRTCADCVQPERSRSPCGERGLKYDHLVVNGLRGGRSPCGERGLKFAGASAVRGMSASLPVRGAWVEMASSACRSCGGVVAPRAGSVG